MSLEARLVTEACEYYGLAEGDFRSPRRGYYTLARWAVTHILAETVGWSESRIARFLGKHHRAIQDGRKQAQVQLRSDPLFFDLVERLKAMICST